ncbi:MAG: right-handed parallel beta-helix repeat-containing protein, partial [Actinomycetes bacterium]
MKNGLRSSLCTLAVVAAFFVASTAFALEPPTEQQIEQYRADGTLQERIAAASALGNDKVSPRLLSSFRSRVLAEQGIKELPFGLWAPPPAWQFGLASTGTPKILAVCIDFPDYPATIPMSKMQTLMDRPDNPQNTLDANYPVESLRAFYQRSSYGKLDLRTDTYGWYRSPVLRSEIPTTPAGERQLIADALAVYDAQGVDFSQYDNNGDGKIDYLMVYWTGPPGEWASFWWGHFTTWGSGGPTFDGVSPSAYSWQWPSAGGQDTPIHETGHALGLPDLYDYDNTVGPNGGVGGFDMMDVGTNKDHNAFSKWMLGWSTPSFVSSGQSNVQLRTAASSGDSLVVMPGASAANMFSEFFMVENRRPSGNDSLMFKNPGLTVWHVDARLSSSNFAWNNSFTSHKYIAVEQADGLHQIEATPTPSAFDAADTWTAGKRFAHLTMPASTRYDSSNPDVTLDSIVLAGTTATLRATVGPMNVGNLDGTVSSSGGGAIAGSTVSVPGYGAVDAGDDGTYSVAGLDPGTYDVTYLKPRYTRQLQSVTISSDTTTTKNVVLVPATPGPFYVSASGSDVTGDGSIGYPFATIQHAIDVAVSGEEVYVRPGVYNEDVTMKDGVSVWGTGATILGSGSGPTVTASSIGATTTISGFTVTGGNGFWGGGISCNNSSLSITGNTITGNDAAYGGGIGSIDSSPTITDNSISGNAGGGINSTGSSPMIAHNSVTGNSDSANSGSGISCIDSTPTITDNTISANASTGYGGGIDSVDSSLTVTRNVITGNSSAVSGGGINCTGSSATVFDNEISGNTASNSYGAGVSFYNSTATIDGNSITGNTASLFGGGGVYFGESSATVTGNSISGNTAGSYGGGGIFVTNFSPSGLDVVTISGNTIADNRSAGYGGGINCFSSSPIISNNEITGNGATNYGGGGIYCANSASTIESNTISRNSAANYGGGGILCAASSSPAITRNAISGNTSANFGGGGIACYDGSSPSVVNNVISANTASKSGGGGIYVGRDSAPVIYNDTIASNTAVVGAGIYALNSTSRPAIWNCIVWNDGDDLFGCSATSSDIQTSADATGTGVISKDPVFVSVTDFHLQKTSPCIDVATSTIAPAVDKDGNTRPYGGGYDMGAYECVLPYVLTYSADPGGSIVGKTPQSVAWGADGTSVIATATVSHHFVGWSDGNTDTTRMDTNVQHDIGVTASFAVNTYTLKYAAGTGGTISGDTSQTVDYGSNGTTVTAEPGVGYHFLSWSDDYPTATRTDVYVTADKAPTANFALNTYTLKYAAGSGGTISSGVTSQTVNYGTSGTAVTALGNAGFHFVDWSDGSTDNPRTDTAVRANVDVKARFAVDTDIYVEKSGSDATGDGSSGKPFATVPRAMLAVVPGHNIHIGVGTFDGDVELKSGVSIFGAGPDATILKGSGTAPVIAAFGIVGNPRLTHFTVTGGSDASGGGISCFNSSPTIDDVIVTDNTGGGIGVLYSSPTITYSTVKNNTGGGINCTDSTPTITFNAITGNTAPANGGGGISCTNSSGTITDNAISGNTAAGAVTKGGGGIYCYASSPVIYHNTITGNTASNVGGGGGILCASASSPRIISNSISGNTAATFGGGIYCSNSSSPTIYDNDITGNLASAYGGGGIMCSSASSPTINSNDISNNTASTYGGGIMCSSASAAVIASNTVDGNTASTYGGGGIYCSSSSPTIAGNAITGNT